MIFHLFAERRPSKAIADTICLCYDKWNDYGFCTAFDVYYCDSDKTTFKLGWLKIAKRGMTCQLRTFDELPKTFSSLDSSFYSLGQSREYYEEIARLGTEKSNEIMIALRDTAFDLSLFETFREEEAMSVSLLRQVDAFTVVNQFHRIATGGAILTRYCFSYNPNNISNRHGFNSLTFEVVPDSKPPSNVHVLIGRNGTGKTTLINNLIYALYTNKSQYGSFSYIDGEETDIGKFANVICVAFSPFDEYPTKDDDLIMCNECVMPYSFIGLDKKSADLSVSNLKQFLDAFEICMSNEQRKTLLLRSVEILMNDPAFSNSGIRQVIEKGNDDKSRISEIFQTLSSGHKVVLLIIACCVEKITEQSLVVIDEPENHLHPPLLSALIRALSDLLIDRNGVAIISTHSPVVLQEVSRDCVWMLRRARNNLIAERPKLQTFGAGVGTLTNEVFGLEVAKSGFHEMLVAAAKENRNYEDALAVFDGNLGDEACFLLRSILFAQGKEWQDD